jgi:CRP/FNR family transcriptional regulator
VPDAGGNTAAVLLKAPVFSGLEENELSFLVERAVRRRYSAGQVFCVAGEPCTGLYVVESGHVRIFTSSAGGREHVLSIEGPGRSVAVMLLFDDGNYPASVAAIEDSTLVFVSKQDFQTLCLTHPQVALKVLRRVGARLRRLVGIVEDLCFTTVRQRLASLLLQQAQKEGRQTRGGVEIVLSANNQEIASLIGTVRESVSRNLSHLHAKGIVCLRGRRVIVLNMEALEAETEAPD